MKSTIAITAVAILLGVALYAGIHEAQQTQIPEEARAQFQEWKRSHNRLYSSPSEDNYRLSVFYKNLRMINAHNAQGHSHTLAINEFSDLTDAEFKARYTGNFKPAPRTTEPTKMSTVGLPASIDWTTRGAVTSVKNQLSCGGCWAFTAAAAIESIKAIKGHGLTDLSMQQLIDCVPGNRGCSGGSYYNGFKYVTSNGIELLSNYPYTMRNGYCHADPSKFVYKINNFGFASKYDNNAIQAAVAQQPVAVSLDSASLSHYSGGIVKTGCGQGVDHGMVIVGYGQEGNDLFWKLKNSWGTGWGEGGYIRIERKTGFGESPCGLNQYAEWPFGN